MMPDLTLRACGTIEERERRRRQWMMERAAKKIRYEAARLRMKIARQLRAREVNRLKRERRSERRKLQAKTHASVYECQKTARVRISFGVMKMVESEEKKKERAMKKSNMKMMEKELLNALGLDTDGSKTRDIEKLPPEADVELESATKEIINDAN